MRCLVGEIVTDRTVAVGTAVSRPWSASQVCNRLYCLAGRVPVRRRVGTSNELRAALRTEVARLRAIDNDVDRIRGVGDVLATLEAEWARVVDVRLSAVARLRAQGWSYSRIVAATGLSKSRVAQLVREAREG